LRKRDPISLDFGPQPMIAYSSPMRLRLLPIAMLLILVSAALFILTGRAGAADPPVPATPQLKTAASNGVQYYLSLPTTWNPRTTWPILVTIDGSGHKFQQNIDAFVKARGALPFVIVTPCVSSNGKEPGDLKAVLEIVDEVREAAHGQPKFFITGFSAGGHLMWQMVFQHPELLAGAAPAAGNFRYRGIDEISKAPERVKLPIHAFQGDKDDVKHFLDPQWEDAVKLAKENGYTNLTRTEVPGATHQPFAPQVVDFFASLLPK
jgi:poly(3-hydroxybutyrate) depolymerase